MPYKNQHQQKSYHAPSEHKPVGQAQYAGHHQPVNPQQYHQSEPMPANQGYPGDFDPTYDQPPQHSDFPGNNQGGNPAEQKGFEQPVWFKQLKSHGGKCAIQCETSLTKKDEWFTISIESAVKDPTDQNNKRFDWRSKTMLQLTRNELPVFIAVLLGMLPSCKFDNHGDQNKFISIENQGKSFFFKTGGSGLQLHTVPVPIAEAYMFATLAVGQYVRNFHGMTPEAAIDIISRMAVQMFSSGGYKTAN
jgi:hypothetical protein